MANVAPHLYVGDEQAYESNVRGTNGWAVVHACKEPYHRQALGYRGRAAPKHHPEYLHAVRDDGRRLILNFVDAPDPAYVPRELFAVALPFIELWRSSGTDVLVHCNHGRSRSPALAIAHLAAQGELPRRSAAEAVSAFQDRYPATALAGGVREFLEREWDELVGCT